MSNGKPEEKEGFQFTSEEQEKPITYEVKDFAFTPEEEQPDFSAKEEEFAFTPEEPPAGIADTDEPWTSMVPGLVPHEPLGPTPGHERATTEMTTVEELGSAFRELEIGRDLRPPVTGEEIKPPSQEWRNQKFNELTQNDSSRSSFLDYGRITLERLVREPTDIKAKTLYEASQKTPDELLDYSDYLAYAFRESKTIYGRTRLALSALNQVVRDEQATDEMRESAKTAFDEIVKELEKKAAIWDVANQPPSEEDFTQLPGTPVDEFVRTTKPLGAEARPAVTKRLGIDWDRVKYGKDDPDYLPTDPWAYMTTLFDVVDLSVKGVMHAWMSHAGTTTGTSVLDEPEWKWIDPSAESGRGRIGGKHLDWDARHKFIKTMAERGNSAPARILVSLGRAFGKTAGPPLAVAALAIDELYKDTVWDSEFEKKYGVVPRHMMYDEYRKNVPPKGRKEYEERYGPKANHWANSVGSALKTISAWEDGVGDLAIDVATDPLTYVGSGAKGIRAAKREISEIISKRRPLYAPILDDSGNTVGKRVVGHESIPLADQKRILAQVDEALFHSELLNKSFVGTADPVKLNSSARKKLKLGEYAPIGSPLRDIKSPESVDRIMRATGRSDKQLNAAKKEYIAAKSESLTKVGTSLRLSRATEAYETAKRTKTLLKGGAESMEASRSSYAKYEQAVERAKLEGDRSLKQVDKPVEHLAGGPSSLRGGHMIPAYAEIASIAHKNGIPLEEVRKVFGKGGANIHRAESTFLGVPIRAPFLGAHPLRRAIHKLSPAFHGKDLEKALALTPRGKLFTYEGGHLERQYRGLQESLEDKALHTAEVEAFSFAPPRFIVDAEYRQGIFENYISPAREVAPMNGLIPDRNPAEQAFQELKIIDTQLPASRSMAQATGEWKDYNNLTGRKAYLEKVTKGKIEEMFGAPQTVETIEGGAIQRRTYPPYRGLAYIPDKKQARPVTHFDEHPSNITGMSSLDERLNKLGEERTITAIGLTEDAIEKKMQGLYIRFGYEETGWKEYRELEAEIGRMKKQLPKLGKESPLKKKELLSEIHEAEADARLMIDGLSEPSVGMEGAIRRLKKEAKRLNIDIPDGYKFTIDTATRKAGAGNGAYISVYDESMLLSYEYRRPSLEDLGYVWPKVDDEGRRIGWDYEGKFEPSIEKDSKGDWYGVKQKLTGREDDYPMTPELEDFLDRLSSVMDKNRSEFIKHGALDEAQAGYDPLTKHYWPHNLFRKFENIKEGLLPSNTFSSASANHAKSKTAQFGIALGDRERLKALEIEPEFNAAKVYNGYIRGMSRKSAQVQLELAAGEHFGLKKRDFMELYRVESDGRGVKQIVKDPVKGSRLIFDDVLPKNFATVSEDIFPGVRANIKVRPLTQEMKYGKRKPRTYLFADAEVRPDIPEKPPLRPGAPTTVKQWDELEGVDEFAQQTAAAYRDPFFGAQRVPRLRSLSKAAEELSFGKKVTKFPGKDRYIVREVFKTPKSFRKTVDGKEIIYIDQDAILKNYHKKPWLAPKVKGVDPLEREFRSPGEWLDFVVAQEKAHVRFKRNRLEPEAAYENRINKLALDELGRVKLAREEAVRTVSSGAPGRWIDEFADFNPELFRKTYLTELRANEEWEKFSKLARNSLGEEIKGSPYKLLDNVNGEEVILNAKDANWVSRIGRDENLLTGSSTYKEIMSQKNWVGSALRGGRSALRSADRNFKRGVLLVSGGFHNINAITDSMMLMGQLGMYDVGGHYKLARQLLNDPESFALKFDFGGVKREILGVDLLAEARLNGIANNSIARLDYWAEGFRAEERLELAALRANGRPYSLEYWKEALRAAGHTDFQGVKAAAKKQWKASLPGRAKRRDFGIKQGEMLAAYWTDTTQLAGFIHQVKHGHSYARAAQRSLQAVLDYGARDQSLNFVRMFAPFASWAVKAPKATIGAAAKRPGFFMVPVKIGQMEESIAIKEEGGNYYIPEWMQEMGNYRRAPKPYKQLVSMGRMLLGGTPLSEEEQVYFRQRAVPLFEALGPIVATSQNAYQMKPWFASPIISQLGPTWRALYEWGAKRNLYTLEPEYGISLTAPFTAGTVIPGLGRLPSYTEKGFSLLNTAPPGQGGLVSRHGAGFLGSIPEVFPGQRLMLSRPGFNLINMAQYYSQGQTGPPVTWGSERRLVGPDQGANLLAQMILGTTTGYTPAVLDPGRQLTSAMNTREQKRLKILQETAYKELRRRIKSVTKQVKKLELSPEYQRKE